MRSIAWLPEGQKRAAYLALLRHVKTDPNHAAERNQLAAAIRAKILSKPPVTVASQPTSGGSEPPRQVAPFGGGGYDLSSAGGGGGMDMNALVPNTVMNHEALARQTLLGTVRTSQKPE
jgi:hypothetical protein